MRATFEDIARALVVLSLAGALGCSSPPPGLEVLVDQLHGAAPDSLEVGVYNRFHQLATERIARPALPGAVRLTALPSASDELRIVVLGIDASQQVQALDATMLGTPVPATTLAIHLSDTFVDGDHDGVPDALDDCPTVADALQNDALGFGNGPGDACSGSDGGHDGGAVPDLATGPDLGGGSDDMGPLGCPTNAFCDSFEEAQVDMTRWMVSQTMGSVVEIDRNHANTGQSSLHVHLPALSTGTLGFATIKEQKTFPQANPPTTIHARAFILVPTAFGNDVAAIMLVEQAVSPFAGIGLQLEAGGFSMFNGLRNQSVAPAGAVRHDQWMCVEWQVIINSAGSAKLWVNGRAEASPAIMGDTTSTPAVGELALGLVANAATAEAARDLWIDDVVVSGQPIGCQ